MPASLLDPCVWLALSFEAHPCHRQTRQGLLNATPEHPWLWCRATQQSFLRLASTPTLLNVHAAPSATIRDACNALQALSGLPQVAVVEEPPNLMACWMKLACLDQAAPKRWMDAYLAALAITGGWRLLTLDRDFLGFVNDGLELQLLQSESR